MVAKEGKSCSRLLALQKVAQNVKSCSKVAEHNLFMPTSGPGSKMADRSSPGPFNIPSGRWSQIPHAHAHPRGHVGITTAHAFKPTVYGQRKL